MTGQIDAERCFEIDSLIHLQVFEPEDQEPSNLPILCLLRIQMGEVFAFIPKTRSLLLMCTIFQNAEAMGFERFIILMVSSGGFAEVKADFPMIRNGIGRLR